MSDNRLIINARGETFKALRVDNDSVALQCSTLYDRVTVLGADVPTTVFTSETTFSFHDIRGIIIQLANAIGDAVELTPSRVPAQRYTRDQRSTPIQSTAEQGADALAHATAAGYVLNCITPGAK